MFNNVIDKIKSRLAEYKADGYETTMVIDGFGYEARISKKSLIAVIRDGYYQGVGRKEEPDLTSFDVLLITDGSVFLDYFSDYPLEEYDTQLVEAFAHIDSFFQSDYQITQEKYFVLWKKKYLHLMVGGRAFHLMETGKVHEASKLVIKP